MMGLLFETSRWTDALWQSHVKRSQSAQDIMHDGTAKQVQFPGFATDVHSALYLKHQPPCQDNTPAWVNELYNQAQALPEWQNLRARCQRNGFAAGLATETILSAIVDNVPQQDEQDEPDQTGQPGQDTGALRRALRQACRAAARAVDEAESALEGLQDALGLDAGTGAGSTETMQDLDTLRDLYAMLRDNPVMKRIAQLAGRLQRLGASHKRCKVTPAVGHIKGVTIGGDLDRVLPMELVGLRSDNKIEKLRTLQKLIDRRVLQYLMQGEEPETRGPIIVCVDESGSMRDGPDVWSKAVALALLSTASQQKRAYTLMGFTEEITHRVMVEPGTGDMAELMPHLTRHCYGGTSFDVPLRAALDVLRTAPSMHKADIIFVTDGNASIDAAVIEELRQAKQAHSVHVYAVCIGKDAQPESLKEVASETYLVGSQPEHDSATVAPIIALV